MRTTAEALALLQEKYPKDVWVKRMNLYCDLKDFFTAFPNIKVVGMMLYTSSAYNDGDVNHIGYYPYVDGTNDSHVLCKDGLVHSPWSLDDEERITYGLYPDTGYEEEASAAMAVLIHMDGALFSITSHIALRAERLTNGSIKIIENIEFDTDEI